MKTKKTTSRKINRSMNDNRSINDKNKTEEKTEELEFTKGLLEKYQSLCKKILRDWSRTIYEWKISFYIGLLLNLAFFLLGIILGINIK